MQQEESRILQLSPSFKLVQFRKTRPTLKGYFFLFFLLLSLFALFLFQINFLYTSQDLYLEDPKQQLTWVVEQASPPPKPQISIPVQPIIKNDIQQEVKQISQNVQQSAPPTLIEPVRTPIIVEQKSFTLPAGYKSLISLTTSIEDMKSLFPRLQVQQQSKQNAGKRFEQISSFTLNIGPSSTSTINGIDYENYGVFSNIQVGSNLDFTNISKLVNFTQLQQAMKDSIAHEVLSFKRDDSLEVVREKISFSGKQNENEIMRAVNSIGAGQQNLGFYTNLAKNANNYHMRQQQFYYYDKKYKISQNLEETPICIYATGYKIFTKNRYKAFFESLDRQNYTNFHIVYVDDNSPDQSAYLVFQYLHELKTRLTNRIKIIHNTQHLGALGNIFFWVKKYCNDGDIVAIIDGDDSIIGTQSFQLLTSVYKNPNTWYAYTKYIQHYPDRGIYRHGVASTFFRGTTAGYRTFYPQWFTSHMRTFRKQVFNAVPIQHIIEYHYDPKNGMTYPNIYGSSADRFQVYSNIQLVGNDRLVFLDEYIYLYDAGIGMTSSRCYHEHQYYDEQKSRIKTPLLKLNQLGEKAKLTQNYEIPRRTLDQLSRRYQNYKNCLRKL